MLRCMCTSAQMAHALLCSTRESQDEVQSSSNHTCSRSHCCSTLSLARHRRAGLEVAGSHSSCRGSRGSRCLHVLRGLAQLWLNMPPACLLQPRRREQEAGSAHKAVSQPSAAATLTYAMPCPPTRWPHCHLLLACFDNTGTGFMNNCQMHSRHIGSWIQESSAGAHLKPVKPTARPPAVYCTLRTSVAHRCALGTRGLLHY